MAGLAEVRWIGGGSGAGKSTIAALLGRRSGLPVVHTDLSLHPHAVALAGGRSLGEHESPGDASLQVLVGTVRLTAGRDVWEGGAGDYLVIPPHRHDLHADTDAVVLLTVATRS